jgi:ribokinase
MIGGDDRENMIAVTQSANDALNAEDTRAANVLLQKSAVVLCQLEIPLETVLATAKDAAENGAIFILNPAPARALPRELFPLVSVLTPNEREALSLTNTDDVDQAARQLLDWGCQQLAITLGAEGVLVCDGNGNKRIAAPKVSAVDTVGAGDCFNGWLAAGLAEGLSLEEAATRAVRAAAISVTRQGSQESMPMRDEVGLE